jgi:hypothetical protein
MGTLMTLMQQICADSEEKKGGVVNLVLNDGILATYI